MLNIFIIVIVEHRMPQIYLEDLVLPRNTNHMKEHLYASLML